MCGWEPHGFPSATCRNLCSNCWIRPTTTDGISKSISPNSPGEWNIEGKSNDKGNPKANNAYGTHRANAYKIIEDTLNLRDTRVYDYIPTEDGKKKAVLNKEETAIAQGKQDLIKQAFQDWIWQNPERRQRLTAYYNENFNAIRPREYDGSHLNFYGMNPEIKLRQHQKNGLPASFTEGTACLPMWWEPGKPIRWLRRRWSASGWDSATNP